jgi:hypothetical protein
MKHYKDEWIEEWCQANGWTDLVRERRDHYWAFPPGAVIPEPIPTKTLRLIKANKGLCLEEKIWFMAVGCISLLGAIFSFLFKCPMPIVLAFAFDAIAVAKLELEEI